LNFIAKAMFHMRCAVALRCVASDSKIQKHYLLVISMVTVSTYAVSISLATPQR